jgi:small subunit ribosomal protein S1
MTTEEAMQSAGTVHDLSAAQENASLGEMLESYLSCTTLRRGEIVPATVVHVGRGQIVLDVGAKSDGVVESRELESLSPEQRSALTVGTEVMAYVLDPGSSGEEIVLSLSRAQAASDWLEVGRLLDEGDVIERRVVSSNRGGVVVEYGKLRGFVPGSQLTSTSAGTGTRESAGDDQRWAGLVGKSLKLKVIEVDQPRNRLILSERAATRRRRAELLSSLHEGDTCHGRVTNLVDFGAFVDIGGIDGLVHLSELSWTRVTHPNEILSVGQDVDVSILEVDQQRQRVALSLKRLQPDPWQTVTDRYQEGQLVEAVITRTVKWGAFASLVGDESIEGLVHISELADRHVVNADDVVHTGQMVTLRVIGLDPARHRMALSLKQASQNEYLEQDWEQVLAADNPHSVGPMAVALSDARLEE